MTVVAGFVVAVALCASLAPSHLSGQPSDRSRTPQSSLQPRPRIGVAFGGGSAKGFAHVGVLRWFEDHHIPIDLVAGTSMGGLVGGAYASGMSSRELAALLKRTDWDQMFGASAYRYKSIQRKEDARAYPSRLEFQLPSTRP